jgi:hypothetical protein
MAVLLLQKTFALSLAIYKNTNECIMNRNLVFVFREFYFLKVAINSAKKTTEIPQALRILSTRTSIRRKKSINIFNDNCLMCMSFS